MKYTVFYDILFINQMKKTIAPYRTVSIVALLTCLGTAYVSCRSGNGLFDAISKKARFAPSPNISISPAMPWYRSIDPATIMLSTSLTDATYHYSINDASVNRDYAAGASLFNGYLNETGITVRAYTSHPDYNDSETIEAYYSVIPTGNIFTIAGTSSPGFSGDNGFAVSAQINQSGALALYAPPSGAALLYVADTKNDRIRMINLSTKLITTIVGADGLVTSQAILNPTAICVNDAGTVMYFADTDPGYPTYHRIMTVTGLDTASPVLSEITSAPILSQIGGMVLDSSGTKLYFSDTGNSLIRLIPNPASPPYSGSTFAGTTIGFSGDGGAPLSAQLNHPTKLCLNAAGTSLYFSDTGNNRIRAINGLGTTPMISTIAGPASLNSPTGIALGPGGTTIYFADAVNNRIGRIAGLSSLSTVTTIAGVTSTAGFDGTNVPATDPSVEFNSPQDVLVDANGNVYIADTGNNCIRQIFNY